MNKIAWVDVLKGVGILSVVGGHIYGGEISRNIYIFHMPLFFFISGFLFTPTTDYWQFFIKKAKSLLIPYVTFWLSISIIFNRLLYLSIDQISNGFLDLLIGGRSLSAAYGVFWFVTCLFLTQQVMNFLITKLDRKMVVYVMALFLAISYVNAYLPDFWLPWNANVVFAAAPIYYIGYYYKEHPIKLNDLLILFAGIVVIILSYIYPNNGYNMKVSIYGYPLITLLSSIILILNIKNLSIIIAKVDSIKLPISEIGKASMVIMYMHQPLQIYIRTHMTSDNTIKFIIATILSYFIFVLLSRFRLTRALYLGELKELSALSLRPIKG